MMTITAPTPLVTPPFSFFRILYPTDEYSMATAFTSDCTECPVNTVALGPIVGGTSADYVTTDTTG